MPPCSRVRRGSPAVPRPTGHGSRCSQGRAGFTSIITKLRTAFPDLQLHVEDVIVEGDRAMVRVTMTGTHKGPLAFVRLPLTPTGKQVKIDQIHVMRVANDRIVETWFGNDALGMFRQLGISVGQ